MTIWSESPDLETVKRRATAAELLACAIRETYPNIQLVEGGPTARGFEYTYSGQLLDLSLLEHKMGEYLREDRPIEEGVTAAASAKGYFESQGQGVLADQLESGGMVPLFQMGKFWGVANGPFCPSAGEVGYFKLISQLDSTISGVVCANKQRLKEFLKLETRLAKCAPHELFVVRDGHTLWHPAGATVRHTLLAAIGDIAQRFGYEQVVTGGCGHAMLFSSKEWSEDDFPVRYYEEESTTLFCREDQLVDQLTSSLQFLEQIVTLLPFECRVWLGSKSETSPLSKSLWSKEESHLVKAVEETRLGSPIGRSAESSDHPFIELGFVDSFGREWRGFHLQLEREPEGRYCGRDGALHTPVKIVQSLCGSIDKLLAVWVEHSDGRFPLWLAPEQVRVIPVGDDHVAYAEEVARLLQIKGIRAGVDRHDDKLGGRIRLAQIRRIPYTLVVGDREMEQRLVTIRPLEKSSLEVEPLDQWVNHLENELGTTLEN